MFIIQLTYTHGLDKIQKYLPDHRIFLDKYYSLNTFICSGAQEPRTGGIILCNASNRKEVELIITEDPFHIHQAASYQIIEFNPSKFAPEFESFIKNRN